MGHLIDPYSLLVTGGSARGLASGDPGAGPFVLIDDL
jgi:hypothetical protein